MRATECFFREPGVKLAKVRIHGRGSAFQDQLSKQGVAQDSQRQTHQMLLSIYSDLLELFDVESDLSTQKSRAMARKQFNLLVNSPEGARYHKAKATETKSASDEKEQ